ncbi:MAG: DUF1049 domain-containing protein [Candidatus Eisenbacteria bacterium]|nr:DUF1049 domain-containing protein [Candidatus Eisenbacteria bacterium]
MWFFKTLLILLGVLILLWLLVPNMNERASISFMWPVDRIVELPVAIALFMAYFLGLLTLYVISLIRDIKLRTQLHRLRRDNQRLRDDLERLRRAPIEDLEGALDAAGLAGSAPRTEA